MVNDIYNEGKSQSSILITAEPEKAFYKEGKALRALEKNENK